MFGGGGPRKPRRGEDIGFQLGVTLKELYNGKVAKIKINRNAVCSACSGKGATREGAVQKCTACRGSGVKIVRMQLGPGMIQQLQQPCDVCRQRGEVISEKDRCKTCDGAKVVPEAKVIEIPVEKGAKNGERVTIYGEGEQEPGLQPGDVIIQIREKAEPDSPWERQGDNLVYSTKIRLVEALTGFEFHITTLDDRVLVVKSEPNTVVKPGDIKVIANEGMPLKGGGLAKGKLFIKFDIIFPTAADLADEKKRTQLRSILPPPDAIPMLPEGKETDEVFARDYTPSQQQQQQQRMHNHDDDDEEDARPRGAQCTGTIM